MMDLAARHRRILALVLCGYVAIALFAPRHKGHEAYPFFHWELFSVTHSERVDVALLVHEVNGRHFDPPRSYFSLTQDDGLKIKRSVRLHKLMGSIIVAIESGDTERKSFLLDFLTREYLSDADSVSADLASIRFNPIERYRTGTFTIEKTFASITK